MSTAPLSIIMTAHNEAELLASSVERVADGVRAWSRPFELLVVENGSVDATARIAASLQERIPEVRVLTLPRADYGAALRAGVLAATGDLVVTFDVDYLDLTFLERALVLVEGDATDQPVIVVGSKRASGALDGRPWHRRAVTSVFSKLLRVGFGLRVTDTHGMKVMRRDRIEPLARRCRFGRDLFDTELVLRAERAGLRTAELPVTVEELRPSRTPVWRRVPRTLLGLARLRMALWRTSDR